MEFVMAAPIPTSFADAYMALNDQQRMKFDMTYQADAKSPDVGLICAIFGVYFFYMGEIGKGIALLLSCCIGFGVIWWVVTMINAKKGINAHNETVAQKALAMVR